MEATPAAKRPEGTCKVAVVQHPPVFLNLAASMEKACSLIADAAAAGAQVIAFPETWLPGYPVWVDSAPGACLWDSPPARALYRMLTDNSLEIPGPQLDRLQSAAHDAGAHVVMGVHERRRGTLFNTMVFIHSDGVQFRLHRKLVPTYTERLVWGRGDGSTLQVLPTEFGPLGGLICWEHWMPLARAATHAHGETIHVAQWPGVNDLHLLASRHYAFEARCFVLAAGTHLTRGDVLAGARTLAAPDDGALELLASIPGDDDTVLQGGGSAVIGPDSTVLAGPLSGTGVLFFDLHLDRLAEARMVLDTDGHYSRPDIFRLQVDVRPQRNVTFESDP